jgi:dihydrofolate reductase
VKAIYYTATSLDGFLADEHNSLDWLFAVDAGDQAGHMAAFQRRIGAMCMGRTTYEWILNAEPDLLTVEGKWHEYHGHIPVWVFTHRTDLPKPPGVDLRFVAGEVRPVYEAAAALGTGDLWVTGGGDLAGQFHDAGLLDELELGITPVTLGAGAPLLPRRIESDQMRFTEVSLDGQLIRATVRLTPRSDL